MSHPTTTGLVTQLRGHYKAWGCPPDRDGMNESIMAWDCSIAADRIDELTAALRELVECKDLKERLDGYEAGSTQEMAAIAEEYDRRKPAAWETARALLAPPPAVVEPELPRIEYCPDEFCCLPKGHEGDHDGVPF